jgi:hypothetical protein
LAKKRGITQKIMLPINPGVEAHTHAFVQTATTDSKFGFSVEKKKKDPAKSTVFKANTKFGRQKSLKTEQKVRQIVEEKVLESGVKVTIKTPKFKKPLKEEKTLNDSNRRNRTSKFAEKSKKSTNYEPYSFKKKSDGSFKKTRKKS